MGTADGDVFRDLTKIVHDLEVEAAAVLDLVIGSKTEGARNRVLEARKVLRPVRTRIAESMQQLYKLKAEFAEIAAIA